MFRRYTSYYLNQLTLDKKQPHGQSIDMRIPEYYQQNCKPIKLKNAAIFPTITMSQALPSLTANRSFLTDLIQSEKPCCALGMVEVEDELFLLPLNSMDFRLLAEPT